MVEPTQNSNSNWFWDGQKWTITPYQGWSIYSSTTSVPDLESAPAEKEIREMMKEITDLLLEKNRKYGNSALKPVRIFSQADTIEQFKVRLDDKLSRIVSAQLDEDEEVLNDMIGYLVLFKIALKDKEC